MSTDPAIFTLTSNIGYHTLICWPAIVPVDKVKLDLDLGFRWSKGKRWMTVEEVVAVGQPLMMRTVLTSRQQALTG